MARNQKEAILNHLKTHGSITQLQANRTYHASRLSAIIFNLRKEGHDIETQRVTSSVRNEYGNFSHYCVYWYKGLI